MRLSYVSYVLGLITVLLFTACDACDDPNGHYWIYCKKDNNVFTPQSFYTSDGKPQPEGTILLNGPTDEKNWSCPNTGGSPIWNNSVVTVPPAKLNLLPQTKPDGRRAAGAASAAYLPQPLLDLPFPARNSGAQSTSFSCGHSQPDVLQVNHDNASVNRITTCPGSVAATIPVVTRPLQIAITPDGLTALVTSYDNAVNFIDLGTNKVTYTLQTGSSIFPNGIAITPDGTYAYITNFLPASASLVKIDLSKRAIVATMPVGGYPQNLFLTPDGAHLYMTFPYGNLVSIVDTQTFTNAFDLTVQAPRGIAFNSTGTKAYIASAGNPDSATLGVVEQFDTATFTVTKAYTVGMGPNDVAVLYFDRFVATTNYEGQSVSVIDTITGGVQTVSAGGQATGLAIVY